VQTRLRKLDEGQYAAIILAAAGLKRLGLIARIRAIISSEDSLPAVGQGALGIECRADRADVIRMLQPLHHPDTAACVLAERAMSRALNGSCQVPLGGFAEVNDGQLRMRGFVASPDGQHMVRAESTGDIANPEALGKRYCRCIARAGCGRNFSRIEWLTGIAASNDGIRPCPSPLSWLSPACGGEGRGLAMRVWY